MIHLFSFSMYLTFISQCIDLCKTSGTSLMERYACLLSLIVVALGAIGFIAEVFNALEYIKGNFNLFGINELFMMIQGTRLALIQYNKTVAAGLFLMSLMRLTLLYLNWHFWLERWKNVVRHFIDEIALDLIPSSEAINRTMATILAILIHDCIHKERLNHITFKKYKKSSLN